VSSMETTRTRLRRLGSDDVDRLVLLESDPEVMKWTRVGTALPREETARRLQSAMAAQPDREPLGIWLADLKSNHELVGWFVLLGGRFDVPELGFMLPRSRWGMGFATEVGKRLVEYAFNELKLSGLVATTNPQNAASIQVLIKLGFALERVMSDTVQGAAIPIHLYRLRGQRPF
jgi:RimJ/RimL family protein N-acetyltransferase